MRAKMNVLSLSCFTAVLLSLVGLGINAPECSAGESGRKTLPFKEAAFYIEFNASAADAGIQVFLDADDWKQLTISDSTGRIIFSADGRRTVRHLGLTELFFESVEPEISDLPLVQFLSLFPEGDYEFKALTTEGTKLESHAEFTHAIPCGPKVTPAAGAVLDPLAPVVVGWQEVTEVVDPAASDEAGAVVCTEPGELGFDDFAIEAYQVILESDAAHLVADLPASARQLTIPAEAIAPGVLYRFEVLAKEGGGNQTITEGFFCTAPLTEAECAALAAAP